MVCPAPCRPVRISGVVPLAQLPVAVLTNYATSASLSGLFAGNFGGSFYGNGGGLTGLNPANLTESLLIPSFRQTSSG